jgi:hypothetical protein
MLVLNISNITVGWKPWHYTALNYHSNELSSVNSLDKLRNRLWTSTRFFLQCMCLFCEFWEYFHVNILWHTAWKLQPAHLLGGVSRSTFL